MFIEHLLYGRTCPSTKDSKMNKKQAWPQRAVFLVSGDKYVNIGVQLGTTGVRQRVDR